jgi:hypothetical protein
MFYCLQSAPPALDQFFQRAFDLLGVNLATEELSFLAHAIISLLCFIPVSLAAGSTTSDFKVAQDATSLSR